MSLPATLTLPYGTQHERQHVLLSLPPGDARAPLLVFIHGGAWRSNAASDHARLAAHLATHGVAVALVEYRLSTSDGGAVRHPQHAQDASDALSFLLRSGDEAWRSRIDPRNTVVAGHSVGVHMCLSMALCAEAASVGKGEVERMPGLPERSQIKAWVGIVSAPPDIASSSTDTRAGGHLRHRRDAACLSVIRLLCGAGLWRTAAGLRPGH
jgi:acetyl esterase/lipase